MRIRYTAPLLLALTLITACDESPQYPVPVDCGVPQTGSDDPLALLGPGHHLGIFLGFDWPVVTAAAQPELDARWDEALAAGLRIGRVQIDWTDLEPTPGTFDASHLDEALTNVTRYGLLPMLTLSTLDTGELTFPEDLMEPDRLTLVNGMGFDDPVVIARLHAMLDWLIPRFVAAGGWLITMGNEADLRIEDYPENEESLIGFVRAARDHIHTIAPELAVTITLTHSAIRQQSSLVQGLMKVMDVAAFTYYCQDDDGQVEGADAVEEDVDDLLAAAECLPLVLQEFGCPAGYEGEPSNISGSPDQQRRFFEAMIDKMSREPRFRVAMQFQFIDWSPELSQLLVDWLETILPPRWVDIFVESHRTLGLCRWEDGTCRPAWETYLRGIERFSGP